MIHALQTSEPHAAQLVAGKHQQAVGPGQPDSHRTLVLVLCVTLGHLCYLQVEDADGEAVAVPAYAAKSRYHKGGSNVGLRAWGICRLLSVKAASKKACTTHLHVSGLYQLLPCPGCAADLLGKLPARVRAPATLSAFIWVASQM